MFIILFILSLASKIRNSSLQKVMYCQTIIWNQSCCEILVSNKLQFRVVFACKWKKNFGMTNQKQQKAIIKKISLLDPCPKYDPKIHKTSFMPILSGWTVPLIYTKMMTLSQFLQMRIIIIYITYILYKTNRKFRLFTNIADFSLFG